MENNIKFQLEEIKKLYDSKSITESEYKSLKDEILFGNKEDSLLNKYKSTNKSDGFKSERNVFNEIKTSNNNSFESNNGILKIGSYILYFIVFFTIVYNIFKPNDKTENTVNEETSVVTIVHNAALRKNTHSL
jgi:ATP-dependent Zn protease